MYPVASRRPEKLEAAAAELSGAGYEVQHVAGNMGSEEVVQGVVGAHRDRFGRLDVLVNNAGITGSAQQMPTTADITTVRAAIETNVIGVIRVTNAMLPLLRRSASARIVNMSSAVGSLTRQSTSTDQIVTGQRVTVDGSAGTVTLDVEHSTDA